MVHAEYVFVASIHLSTTLVYTLIQKSLGVMKSEPMLTPREKSPLPEKKIPWRRIEPMMLHQARQRAQHITNELFWPPYMQTVKADHI